MRPAQRRSTRGPAPPINSELKIEARRAPTSSTGPGCGGIRAGAVGPPRSSAGPRFERHDATGARCRRRRRAQPEEAQTSRPERAGGPKDRKNWNDRRCRRSVRDRSPASRGLRARRAGLRGADLRRGDSTSRRESMRQGPWNPAYGRVRRNSTNIWPFGLSEGLRTGFQASPQPVPTCSTSNPIFDIIYLISGAKGPVRPVACGRCQAKTPTERLNRDPCAAHLPARSGPGMARSPAGALMHASPVLGADAPCAQVCSRNRSAA